MSSEQIVKYYEFAVKDSGRLVARYSRKFWNDLDFR